MSGVYMSELVEFLNSLPDPIAPDIYNDEESKLLLTIIKNAEYKIKPYDGEFKAGWLLSGYNSDIWHATNRDKEKNINGEWKNTLTINWGVTLPNSLSLIDKKYEIMLDVLKSSSFLLRSGFLSSNATGLSWHKTTLTWLSFARWVILHEETFRPDRFGLSLIDQNSLNFLFRQLSIGGWLEALQIPQRLLERWMLSVFGEGYDETLIENPYSISTKMILVISEYLNDTRQYTELSSGRFKQRRIVCRNSTLNSINESFSTFNNSYKLTAFFRQFETDFSDSELLVPVNLSTEYPHHKTQKTKNAGLSSISIGTVKNIKTRFKSLLASYQHKPEYMIPIDTVSLNAAYHKSYKYTKPPSHTPFIPADVGFKYLNESIKWVHCYGDALVDFYLMVVNEIDVPDLQKISRNKRYKLTVNAFNKSLGFIEEQIVNGDEYYKCIHELNITSFKAKSDNVDFSRIRKNPTLSEAVDIFVGACTNCISFLKPSRDDEIVFLDRDCLIFKNGGYFLNYRLGKSNYDDLMQTVMRPIPYVTAKAIMILQKLGDGLSSKYGDAGVTSNRLFCLPHISLGKLRSIDLGFLNTCLDKFCDYVAISPDELGRRWYVRIHEARKWFLILLFWSGKYDVLDAARYIAGHTDVEHIYAYIENEFPGECLKSLDSEYTANRLYEYDYSNCQGNYDDGLDELYSKVINHFGVNKLCMIPSNEWKDYVSALREEEIFYIQPHSIYAKNSKDIVGINVSFVLSEVVRG